MERNLESLWTRNKALTLDRSYLTKLIVSPPIDNLIISKSEVAIEPSKDLADIRQLFNLFWSLTEYFFTVFFPNLSNLIHIAFLCEENGTFLTQLEVNDLLIHS